MFALALAASGCICFTSDTMATPLPPPPPPPPPRYAAPPPARYAVPPQQQQRPMMGPMVTQNGNGPGGPQRGPMIGQNGGPGPNGPNGQNYVQGRGPAAQALVYGVLNARIVRARVIYADTVSASQMLRVRQIVYQPSAQRLGGVFNGQDITTDTLRVTNLNAMQIFADVIYARAVSERGMPRR